MYGQPPEERFTPDKYQLMHIEMFPYGIIHAECLGGGIDLLFLSDEWHISTGCVSTELETLPRVALKGDLCADLPSKTECFGIENGNLREGCPLSN